MVSEGYLLFNVFVNDLEREMNNEIREFVDAAKLFKLFFNKILIIIKTTKKTPNQKQIVESSHESFGWIM